MITVKQIHKILDKRDFDEIEKKRLKIAKVKLNENSLKIGATTFVLWNRS